MSGTGGGGSGLYSALKSLQFPEIDKFTPDSLDWLFEVCRRRAVGPMKIHLGPKTGDF